MTTELGIWSLDAAGFVDTGIYSDDEAQKAIDALVEQGEDGDQLEVQVICPDHEEQPRDGCEDCAADEAEDDQEL